MVMDCFKADPPIPYVTKLNNFGWGFSPCSLPAILLNADIFRLFTFSVYLYTNLLFHNTEEACLKRVGYGGFE